jgi:hypothetical protein
MRFKEGRNKANVNKIDKIRMTRTECSDKKKVSGMKTRECSSADGDTKTNKRFVDCLSAGSPQTVWAVQCYGIPKCCCGRYGLRV